MSRRQLPRTTAAILDAATFLPGEIAVDTTNDELRYDGDGSTVGGIAVARKDGTNLTASPSLVTATGTTTARTLAARFADALNLKDFGAVGDGVTDDTVAVQAWIEACRNNAKIGFAPDGHYLCDALTFGPLVQANTPGLYGTDANTCRFIKKTNNSSPLITFNSSAATTYIVGMTIQNIGFVGGSSGPVVRSYSMVRSEFIGCEMTGGSIGVEQLGGIGMEYANCGIHGNGINLKIRKYTASIGTGYPNLTTVTGGYITNATTTNVDFDDGKRLELHGVDVEGAVTNILVGANIGSEDSVESYGVVVFGGWIEAATGTAAVSCASGLNCFYAVEVAANSATYDFSFTGGRYVLRDLTGPTSKTTSVLEGASVGVGNVIENVKLGGAISVDPYKTRVFNGAIVPRTTTFRNRLFNGTFAVNQRLASTNADDTYLHDRWYALTQTGTIAASSLTDPEDGAPTAIRLTQSQASAQRMGIAQIIEGLNCRDLRGKRVSLSGRLRCSSSQAIRYAILEWTGTSNSVTSDVVLDWTSSSFAANAFFLASNITVTATGSVTPTADTWTTFTLTNKLLGSSLNNIVIMLWTEATAAQNVTLDFNRVQFEEGQAATPFEATEFDAELFRCQRYFEKSFQLGTAPAQNVGAGTGEDRFLHLLGGSVSVFFPSIPFKVPKRGNPTMTLYSPQAASAEIYNATNAASFSSSAATNVSQRGFSVGGTSDASAALGNALRIHWTADIEL